MPSTFRIVMQDYFRCFFRTQMTNLVNRVIQVVGMSVRGYFAMFSKLWDDTLVTLSRFCQSFGWMHEERMASKR